MHAEIGSAAQVQRVSPWVRAHQDVLDVALARAGLERREGGCLLEAFRQKAHHHLGYGAFGEYTDRHLGYGHHTARDKLRTAEALERLPELARAQRGGELHASAVRELARVATPETEREWITAASGRRVREIERLVAGRGPGDRPSDTPRRELERHVLRFEVSGETLAAFRGAMQTLRGASAEPLDDDAALLMIARSVLSGQAAEHRESTGADDGARNGSGADDGDGTSASSGAGSTKQARAATGRARHQISVMICERCQQGFQQAGADQVAISPAMLEAARCDARVVETTHMGSVVQPARAAQSIPAAVRRRVIERDHHRCQVPGCRNTLEVDVHHIRPRADGGSHALENLITLCGAHHRAVHAGHLEITGEAPHGLACRHADGTPYGGRAAAAEVDISEKVFHGLRGLGFKETEAKRALARARADSRVDAEQPLTAQELLKLALAALAPRAAPRA